MNPPDSPQSPAVEAPAWSEAEMLAAEQIHDRNCGTAHPLIPCLRWATSAHKDYYRNVARSALAAAVEGLLNDDADMLDTYATLRADLARREREVGELRDLLARIVMIEPNELAAIRNLVNGTSLPMVMQPARERWLTRLDALASELDEARAALTAPVSAAEGGEER